MTKMLKTHEAADRLGVPVSWIYKAIKKGVLPAIRLTEKGRYFIPENAVDPDRLIRKDDTDAYDHTDAHPGQPDHNDHR